MSQDTIIRKICDARENEEELLAVLSEHQEILKSDKTLLAEVLSSTTGIRGSRIKLALKSMIKNSPQILVANNLHLITRQETAIVSHGLLQVITILLLLTHPAVCQTTQPVFNIHSQELLSLDTEISSKICSQMDITDLQKIRDISAEERKKLNILKEFSTSNRNCSSYGQTSLPKITFNNQTEQVRASFHDELLLFSIQNECFYYFSDSFNKQLSVRTSIVRNAMMIGIPQYKVIQTDPLNCYLLGKPTDTPYKEESIDLYLGYRKCAEDKTCKVFSYDSVKNVCSFYSETQIRFKFSKENIIATNVYTCKISIPKVNLYYNELKSFSVSPFIKPKIKFC